MLLAYCAGIATSWGIDCSMVHIFGVNNTSLGLLLILVKTLYNVLSFLVTWERFVISWKLYFAYQILNLLSSIMRIMDLTPADMM